MESGLVPTRAPQGHGVQGQPLWQVFAFLPLLGLLQLQAGGDGTQSQTKGLPSPSAQHTGM